MMGWPRRVWLVAGVRLLIVLCFLWFILRGSRWALVFTLAWQQFIIEQLAVEWAKMEPR